MQLAMGPLSSDELKALATCIIFLLAVMTAIIIALLYHQRKMAELMRSDLPHANGLAERVDALQGEIRELKALLVNQAPSLKSQSLTPTTEEIQQRVG
jgi:hypothetical protein